MESKMISIASGFQYSVNIGFDLNNNDKLSSFIPTRSFLSLLEEILLSTATSSTDRARILVGAYGKGKSHIVLAILAILMKKDLSLFEKALPKIKGNKKLYQLVCNYYESPNKLLPVIISGSNTSLTQAFLIGLQRTLSDNDLSDIMPETNYKAAVTVIERWKTEYPDTYNRLKSLLDRPSSKFVEDLNRYDISAYEMFESIYPKLTSGGTFNPFLGFDVVDLYESVAKSISTKGYTGIYVVYDEFSKYLEANITTASVSDTKMLQDFAEKCNRSGILQLHLMLISHKEISNYIDKLPKQKIDGWRGVSERFRHIHLNNNFSQTYEIISSVIQKNQRKWNSFIKKNESNFNLLREKYERHPIFSDDQSDIDLAILGCYPLHPVSTFILPRLSERIAQNERTLFTFLSAKGDATLYSFLNKYDESKFDLITPDLIYDYFEPLLRKEISDNEIHDLYLLSANILAKVEKDSLEAKIVKTIALIYIVAQFERLKPTKDEIIGIYSYSVDVETINHAIDNLIEREFVIYLKKSNQFLRMKQSSGVDIWSMIKDYAAKIGTRQTVKETLNSLNFDNYIYPARYNDQKEMTRYFSFQFIDESEVSSTTNWIEKSSLIKADGVVYAIVLNSEESVNKVLNNLLISSTDCQRNVFILLRRYEEIETIARDFAAVSKLKAESIDDPVLFDEYDVVFDDLRDVTNAFIFSYTHPERLKARYIYNGYEKDIKRKAELTELLSSICEQVYSATPVINNEAVNRDEITGIAATSRNKIVSALLRTELEPNLGLVGFGQDVSIMRSTLIRPGILVEKDNKVALNLHPDNLLISQMLSTIENFLISCRKDGPVSFDVLYDLLTLPEYHISLRKGLIPIYLAAVLHQYKRQIVVTDLQGQISISADLIQQINLNPSRYSVSFVDWNQEKEDFISKLTNVFYEYIIETERRINSYEFISNAMKRWYLSLPKYSRECKTHPNGIAIDQRFSLFLRAIGRENSSYDLLFVKLPKIFGYSDKFSSGLAENIQCAKNCYDKLIPELLTNLEHLIKADFINPKNHDLESRMSLTSVIREWLENLNPEVFNELFADGSERLLELCKTISNDTMAFVNRVAKLVTGLRVEDWDSSTQILFEAKLLSYKKTIESFKSRTVNEAPDVSGYKILFVDSSGKHIEKNFDKVERSSRGQLLYNQIASALSSMGQSISTQEKRQVIMEVLEELIK